jgi:hypothetical protein
LTETQIAIGNIAIGNIGTHYLNSSYIKFVLPSKCRTVQKDLCKNTRKKHQKATAIKFMIEIQQYKSLWKTAIAAG